MTADADWEAFRTELRSAIDIVEVISDVVALKKAGRSFKGLCPFHTEKTPSFHVDREKGLYYCYGCGRGGDAFRFVQEQGNLTFPEASERLAERYHVRMPQRGASAAPRADEREKLRLPLVRAQKLFRDELHRGGEPADYLRRRGLDPERWDEFGFGYAPEAWDFVTGRLGRDFAATELERCGLAIRHEERGSYYDRFRGRVMVSIHDGQGKLIGFGGRVLGAGEPKYLNSPESPLFDKSTTLFNLHRARSAARERVILVEGYFDAISLAVGGFPEVVATLGTSLTERHAQGLRRLGARVLIAYDGDAAGQKAAVRALPMLLAQEIETRVVAFPTGKDPDDVLRDEGAAAFEQRLAAAVHPIDFLIARENDLTSPDGRRGAAWRIVEVLAAHPDRAWKFSAAERLADRLSLPVEVLWEKLGARKALAAATATAAAAPALPRPIDSAERRLLELMLRRSEVRDELARRLEEGDFESEAHREIFRTLCDPEAVTEPLDFRRLIAHVKTDAAAASFSALAIGDGPAERPGELEENITIIQKRTLRRLGEGLQAEVSRLDSHDPARLDAMMRAKVELVGRRHGLGKKSPR